MKKPTSNEGGPGRSQNSTTPDPRSLARARTLLEKGLTNRAACCLRCASETRRAAVLERQIKRLMMVLDGPQGLRQWAICGFALCLCVTLQALSTWPVMAQTFGVLEQYGRSSGACLRFVLGHTLPVSSLALMLGCTCILFASSQSWTLSTLNRSRISLGYWRILPSHRTQHGRSLDRVNANPQGPKNLRPCSSTARLERTPGNAANACRTCPGRTESNVDSYYYPNVNSFKSGVFVRAARCFLIQRSGSVRGVQNAEV
jgi:hypothetical protein